MNPLGWKSAIYDLARAGDQPMADVAESMLQGVRARGSAPLEGDRLVQGLGAMREGYTDFLATARAATLDEAGLADQLGGLADHLRAVESLREVPGSITGHARSARRAAEEVVGNLRAGIGPGHADQSTHVAMWNLRNGLDQAWNELGMQKVMGGLRGQVTI